MPWARIHDGAMSNPKVIGLIDWRNPFCLWVWGLSYCQTHLTDGVIPRAAIPNPTAARTARKLETAGLWTLHDLGFMVHDYLEWNDSRETVVRKRREAKERIANSRKCSRERTREQSTNISRTYAERSQNVLRGVDLKNVPKKEDPPCSREHFANVRANTEPRVVLVAEELVRWFDRIYAAYPNKDRKIAANEAWVQLGPDLATAQAILADIERRKRAGWVRFERRFIPHLVRFLEERQWEDDTESVAIHEENDDGPHAWQCAKCGAIHEGTADQLRRALCLKNGTA